MKAIVYTSNTGYTARYAKMLGEITALPVYELDAACKMLEKGTSIIYLGWLFASMVKGYDKASKRFAVKLLCGVGMCETGTLLEEVRKANRLPADLPLFTLQGGMDHGRLRGINKFMIRTLIRVMSAAKSPTENDKRKLQLIRDGGDYVSQENLAGVISWLKDKEAIHT